MARHPVAVPTKQRPPGNNREKEASDDESRKKRCTVPSPQREAISASEQALRDYEDYLLYYGLKEYYAPYVDSADCDTLAAEKTAATVETSADDNDTSSHGSDSEEEAGELESAPGDDHAPDHPTASAILDAPIAADEDTCQNDHFATTQEEDIAQDTFDKVDDPTSAGVSPETSWAWALDSVGHVRGPSTSSSCTAESVGTASRASSWAEVHTPLPRRKCAGSALDNEWEVVLNSDDGSASFLWKTGS